jgi:DNA-binding transcriptional LysR family regulator
MEIDSKLLKSFRAVAERRSFTAAGKVLGLTQSAISQQIRALETELDATLLTRSNKLVQITPAGEIFLQCAKQVLDKLDQARSLVAEYSRSGGGRLSIGASVSVCQWLLPPVVAEFHQRYPKMELVIASTDTDEILERVATRALDLALLPLPPITPGQLRTAGMGQDELLVAVAIDNPLAQRERVAADDLRKQSLIVPRQQTSEYTVWSDFLIEAGIFPSIAVETDNLELAKALVISGVGVTIAPRWALGNELAGGQIRALQLGRPGLRRNWCIAYHQAAYASAMQNNFLKMCSGLIPRLLSGNSLAREPQGNSVPIK